MPPFCAPAPPYLMSEPRPRVISPPPEENEDDDRAEMVASLVNALTDAEAAAAEEGNADSPEQQHLLATQAYTSLCFDFPIVATNALAALTSAFRSSSLSIGTPVFPITERFTSGLRYLVSIESTKQSTLDASVATEDVNAEQEGESIDDSKFPCRNLFELCGCAFLLEPAQRIAVAYKDDGASLLDFLAAYNPSPADLLEEDCISEDSGLEKDPSTGVNTSELETEVQNPTVYDEVAAEEDHDDSDWEALETFLTPSQAVMSEEPTVPQHRENAAWSYPMGKVALLTRSVPIEVIDTGVWDELLLSDHLIQALNGMRMLEKEMDVDVSSTAKLYADLLSDHILLGWSMSSSEVTRVLSTLMRFIEPVVELKHRKSSSAVENPSIKTWNALVLSTLARICSKVGGYPARKMSLNSACATTSKEFTSKGSTGRRHDSTPSPFFIRTLWQSVFSNVQFLQVQLTEAQGGSDSSQLEMVLWILCFLVKCAPGNVDLRATFLEGGIFRIALQLFVKVGVESQMEPLRHFLLLSMGSSPALAEFAARVPSFVSAISATDLFVEGSLTRAHAVIWPLIMRAALGQSSSSRSTAANPDQFKSSDAEGIVVAAFDGIVEAVADGTIKTAPYSFLRKLVWLHWLLVLLEEATAASSGSTFKLWQRRSPLDLSIGRCQVALGSLLVQGTATAAVSSPRQKKREKSEDLEDDTVSSDGSADNSMITSPSDESKERSLGHSAALESELVAVQEKLKELLPSMMVQLKLLSALTKGNRETKID